MRSERVLADGTRLAWGFDASPIGFFLEVRRPGRRLRCYDGLQLHYEHGRPVYGLLKFLVETEVVSEDALDAVLVGEPDCDEDVPSSVRLVADILDDVRRAAGE